MSRPSTARKVTRKTEEKRDAALDEGLKLTIDGAEHVVRAGDLTALDSRELRRQVGMSFTGLMQAFASDPDIDLIAAIVWLARRIRGEALLSYDDVAGEMGYDVLDRIEFAEPEPEETDGTDPEG
jgi:hypothetical protein